MNPEPPPYSEVLIIAGVLYLLPGVSMIRAGKRVIRRAEKEAAARHAEWEEQRNAIAEQTKEETAKLWKEQKDLFKEMAAMMSDFEKEHAYARTETAPKGTESSASSPKRTEPTERKKEQLPKMITCSGCGAQSRVNPNSSVVCSYCGATISYT